MKKRLLLLLLLVSAFTSEVFSQGAMSGPTTVVANGSTSYNYSFQYTTCSPQSMCFFVSGYSGGPGVDITVNGVNVTGLNGLFPCVSGGVWATFSIVFNNPGNYSFGFETDGGHCTGVAGFVSTFPAQNITANPAPPCNAGTGSNQTTTCTNPTASLTGFANGGTPGYSFSWSPATGLSNPNVQNPTANPASTTTYTLTITDAVGCTDTDQVTVTVDETPPNANAGANQTTTCTNPTQVLNGSGGGSYSWSPTTGLSNPNIANPTANPASNQVYTLTVTGSNGCTDTDAVTVFVSETPPNANAGANQTTTCTNPTQVLNGSGGGSYSWSPTTGLSNPNIANPTANPSSTTNYTLTVTGSNGCTDTDAVTVTVNETPPTANAGSNQTTTCTNPTQVLNGSGGGSYSWSPATGLSNPNIANPTANPASTQTYTLTVTGLNGCTDTDAVTVTVNETPPTANAGSNQTTTCTNPTQVLSGSGGGTYSWSPATGLSNPSIANPTADPGSTQTYTLTVTGSNGCTDTDVVTVTVDETAPTANAGSNQTTTCTNPTQVLSGSGGGTYSWSPATGLSNPSIANPTADPGSTQTYTLTVTGSNGCTDTDAVTVTVDETAPTVNAGTDQTIPCGATSANLTATGTGTFSWSPATGLSDPNSANPVASPTSSTTYTVTLTGANGCTNTDDVQVTVVTGPTTSAAGPNQTICVAAGGVILAGNSPTVGTGIWTQVSGPTSNISAPTSPSSTVTGMTTAGTYVYEWTITSAPCPASSDQVTIQVDLDANASFSFASPSYCQSSASDTANVTGTTGGLFAATPSGLSIDPVTGIIDFATSTSGTYDVSYIISGVCGASSTETITIEAAPGPPNVSTTSSSTEICEGEQLELLGSGSGAGVTYNVYDAATNGTLLGTTPLIISPTTNTTYYVEAVGSNGCTNLGGLSSLAITVNAAPAVDAGPNQTLCPGFSTNLTATGAPDFVWSTSEGSATIAVSPTVTSYFYVTGTGTNGCTAEDSVLVTIVDPGTITALDDNYDVTTAESTILNVSDNDTYNNGVVSILSAPTNGTAVANGDGTVTYTSNAGYTGSDSFQYTICDANCAVYCDTATVQLTVTENSDIQVSGGFSPNDDGTNETFNILGLENFPSNTLSIYNRWGNLVYQASPYENDWDGTSNVNGLVIGERLTTGTYLYILDLDGQSDPLKGTLELKRD
ncbi:MAG: gliding motility-associated C-terminal domain-containing protein [Crocinitomicaceae bacterium]